VLALAAHLYALDHIDVSEHIPGIWFLHLAVFPLFFFFLFVFKRDSGALNLFIELRFRTAPRLATLALAGLLAYAMADIYVFRQGDVGDPEIKNGKYVLVSRGKFDRETGEAEYHEQRARIMESYSAAWMVMFAAPALYFALRRKV
jgi:hypothetical protein